MATHPSQLSALKLLRKDTAVEDLSLDPIKTIKAIDERYIPSSSRVALTALRRTYPDNPVFIHEMKKRYPMWKKIDTSQKATQKQENNYIAWDKIIEFRDEYYEEMSPVQRLLMALYTYIPPVRLDFTPMKIVARKPRTLEDGINYYVNCQSPYFLMHAFKTHAALGDRIIKVPAKLKTEIDKFLSPGQQYLLETDGKPWRENYLGQMVTKMFKQYHNMSTGVSMLRHAYATKFHAGQLPLADIQKTASAMLHGPLQSMTYRFISLE
jgi:hypothetical protein